MPRDDVTSFDFHTLALALDEWSGGATKADLVHWGYDYFADELEKAAAFFDWGDIWHVQARDFWLGEFAVEAAEAAEQDFVGVPREHIEMLYELAGVPT